MKYFLTILALALLLVSCQREPIEVIEYEQPVINPSSMPITGGLIGTAITADQNAVADAIVSLPGHQTTTDENGRFSFENITLYADGTYLTIEKPGMHIASRKFYAIEGETNVVQLEMTALQNDLRYDSGIDEIMQSDFIEFSIPSSDYLLSANEVYGGEVILDVIELPLGANENSFNLPGDFTGVDKDFETKAISNFGIFKFHITSQSGDQLRFPTDHTVSFEFNFADIGLPEIPDGVSLWNFDEFNGTWIERGEVSYFSSVFSGEINESGYWMIGKSYDYADIKGNIVDSNFSFPDTRLDVRNFEKGYLNSFHTTMSGMYAARVPQDVNLDLVVFHDCSIGRQIENLGALNSSQEIETIEVEVEMDNIEIQGKITECDGTNNSMSYLKVNIGDDQYMHRSDEFGNFNFSFSNCNANEVSVVAIDDQTSKVSEALVLPIHNMIEIGELETCGEVEAGYDISYPNMNWSENLETSVIHEWTVSRVTALETKTIFSAKMIDQETGELYLNAAFVFGEGATTAEYALNFKTQGGFAIFGLCDVVAIDHGGITSYRFVGIDNEVEGVDTTVFGGGIDQVNFNLVYYD